MREVIRQRARELGFDECRVAEAAAPEHAARFREWLAEGRHGGMTYLERTSEKRVDPRRVLEGVRSVVVLAASYHIEGPDPAGKGGAARTGVVARYARHMDYHDVLVPAVRELGAFIDAVGGPGVRSVGYVDTGPVLERDLGQRAGLGFIGKHTNLIGRGLGNWFLLGVVLTTAVVEPDEPERNRCGSCARCLEACPTGAITAPFRLDARRCISYLTIELKGPIPVELRRSVGGRVFGCDDCLAVCPWNRFAREGAMLREHRRPDLAAPDLVGLLELDAAAFKRRFAGTPMLRAKRRGLLRNAAVALGNVGDRAALPALERALSDPEPLVAEHAAWAIGEIGLRNPPG